MFMSTYIVYIDVNFQVMQNIQQNKHLKSLEFVVLFLQQNTVDCNQSQYNRSNTEKINLSFYMHTIYLMMFTKCTEMYCPSSLFSPSNTKEKEQYISLYFLIHSYFNKSKLSVRNIFTQKPVLYICLNISESKISILI